VNVTKTNTNFIAERRLLVSRKNSRDKWEVCFKVSEPYVMQADDVQFSVDGVIAACRVEIEGLDVPALEVHGVDFLHAINMATDIEPLVESLSGRYDFFWITGEPYFDDLDEE
jgi:hypothetical protein